MLLWSVSAILIRSNRIFVNHCKKFQVLFPENKLKPKHNFLLHYPMHILNFDPPIRYRCFRFEAKHPLFKKFLGTVKKFWNPINISKNLPISELLSTIRSRLFEIKILILWFRTNHFYWCHCSCMLHNIKKNVCNTTVIIPSCTKQRLVGKLTIFS